MKVLNMKKNLVILMMSALGASSLISSCTDLSSDKYFDDRKTLTTVFTDKTQTQEWLAYAYSFLQWGNQDVCSKGSTNHCFADDMYYGDRDSQYGNNAVEESYNAFKLGNYNEDWNQDCWNLGYKGIYQASVFIHNVDMNTEMTEEDRIDYKGQARFVRAYYYWLLLRRYGPVPIMPDEGVDYTKSYDEVATPRSTYEEVAQYIATEMEQAAKEIQFTKRDPDNICRPTKGAALATRALAYIYAASPLANGQLQNGQHPSGVTDNIAKEMVNKDGSQLLSTSGHVPPPLARMSSTLESTNFTMLRSAQLHHRERRQRWLLLPTAISRRRTGLTDGRTSTPMCLIATCLTASLLPTTTRNLSSLVP